MGLYLTLKNILGMHKQNELKSEIPKGGLIKKIDENTTCIVTQNDNGMIIESYITRCPKSISDASQKYL